MAQHSNDIDLSQPDLWDDTELIKAYDESIREYQRAHDPAAAQTVAHEFSTIFKNKKNTSAPPAPAAKSTSRKKGPKRPAGTETAYSAATETATDYSTSYHPYAYPHSHAPYAYASQPSSAAYPPAPPPYHAPYAPHYFYAPPPHHHYYAHHQQYQYPYSYPSLPPAPTPVPPPVPPLPNSNGLLPSFPVGADAPAPLPPDGLLGQVLLAWYYSGYYTGRYHALQSNNSSSEAASSSTAPASTAPTTVVAAPSPGAS